MANTFLQNIQRVPTRRFPNAPMRAVFIQRSDINETRAWLMPFALGPAALRDDEGTMNGDIAAMTLSSICLDFFGCDCRQPT